MTWSYSSTAPSATIKDKLRLMVGDTNTSNQLLQDEEIEYLSTSYSDLNMAASILCRTIASKYAIQADTTNGDLRVNASQRYKQYLEMAKDYERQSNSLATPWAGGRLLSDKETAEEDTTITQPAFKRGIHDFPGNNESLDNDEDENNWD